MKKTTRAYRSPVREAQARETREAILRSVAAWVQENPHGEFTLDVIARRAGIERRTVFRHFPTKDALLAAFWSWINERVAPVTLPTSLGELLTAPRTTFVRFDAEEGLIRASLHTGAGREMRGAQIAERRRAFSAALAEVTDGSSPSERRNFECVAHALYSAAGWETMRDYAGATGEEAGAAVAWALTVLADAVRSGRAPKTFTQKKE